MPPAQAAGALPVGEMRVTAPADGGGLLFRSLGFTIQPEDGSEDHCVHIAAVARPGWEWSDKGGRVGTGGPVRMGAPFPCPQLSRMV